ncbi:hypothetical protein V1522DRAFT_394634 [Lipomyces starkeyi]
MLHGVTTFLCLTAVITKNIHSEFSLSTKSRSSKDSKHASVGLSSPAATENYNVDVEIAISGCLTLTFFGDSILFKHSFQPFRVQTLDPERVPVGTTVINRVRRPLEASCEVRMHPSLYFTQQVTFSTLAILQTFFLGEVANIQCAVALTSALIHDIRAIRPPIQLLNLNPVADLNDHAIPPPGAEFRVIQNYL